MILRVIVVVETEELFEQAQAAIAEIGNKLGNKRTVSAHIRRFGRQVAADPSQLLFTVYNVVGFCSPSTDRPSEAEPLVIHEGKAVPVSVTYLTMDSDYWIVTAAELNEKRDRIVATFARRMAEDLFLSEAIAEAVLHQADEDDARSGFSIDPKSGSVDLHDDTDGAVAKRLPKWIKVEGAQVCSDLDLTSVVAEPTPLDSARVD